MKILYIGHYKESGGWSQAAKDYILALDSIGIDVVCRNVTLTKDNPNTDKRLLKLEEKDSTNCDYCIQHILPHHLVGSSKFKKNIAFLASESTSIKHIAWFNNLQIMDEVWVPNNDSKFYLEQDNINLPIKVIPHCFDVEKYTQKYKAISIPQAEGKFKFYYIGDLNDRKNLRSIIRCFHSEFDKSEPACLIFKLRKYGMSAAEVNKLIDSILVEEKTKLRIHKDITQYNKDVIISEDISEENVYSLHQYADCFVCPSHGEAWSIPSFEAMAFGNTPICSKFGGPKDFIDNDDINTGKCIDGVLSVCQCSDAAFPDIFTGKEYWLTPSEKDIKETMRMYYNTKDEKQAKIAGLTRAKMFSYENIANKIVEALSE